MMTLLGMAARRVRRRKLNQSDTLRIILYCHLSYAESVREMLGARAFEVIEVSPSQFADTYEVRYCMLLLLAKECKKCDSLVDFL